VQQSGPEGKPEGHSADYLERSRALARGAKGRARAAAQAERQGGDPANWTLLEAQRQKEIHLAEKHRLDKEEREGRLVDREAAERLFFHTHRLTRDRWQNWIPRVAPLVAADLGIDQVKLAVVLEKYVRQELVEQATPEFMLGARDEAEPEE
jgi:hypothetical protein